MDAATKRFVKQAQKDSKQRTISWRRKILDSNVDTWDCSNTNGGRRDVDLDMRKNRILNLILP